jgi:hypothetical protein
MVFNAAIEGFAWFSTDTDLKPFDQSMKVIGSQKFLLSLLMAEYLLHASDASLMH